MYITSIKGEEMKVLKGEAYGCFHLLCGWQRLTLSKPVGKHLGGTQNPLLGGYTSPLK